MKRNESVHAGMKMLRASDVSDAWVSCDGGCGVPSVPAGRGLRACRPPRAHSVRCFLCVRGALTVGLSLSHARDRRVVVCQENRIRVQGSILPSHDLHLPDGSARQVESLSRSTGTRAR